MCGRRQRGHHKRLLLGPWPTHILPLARANPECLQVRRDYHDGTSARRRRVGQDIVLPLFAVDPRHCAVHTRRSVDHHRPSNTSQRQRKHSALQQLWHPGRGVVGPDSPGKLYPLPAANQLPVLSQRFACPSAR